MYRRSLAAAALLIACGGGGSGYVTPPPAATGTVQGRVANEADEGISNVTVQLTRAGAAGRNAMTGSTGGYAFSGVEPGGWTLTAQLPSGFEPVGSLVATVQVTANQTAQVPVIRMRQSGPPTAEPQIVAIGDNFFNPTPVQISVGGAVRWLNSGTQAHNSTGPGWASPNLNYGQSYDRTFPTAGTFDYECTLHPGMIGRVIVQ
jgi:plastocyanin